MCDLEEKVVEVEKVGLANQDNINKLHDKVNKLQCSVDTVNANVKIIMDALKCRSEGHFLP